MNVLRTTLLAVLAAGMTHAQVTHYSGTVHLVPEERHIDAKLTLAISDPVRDQLLLNSDLKVTSTHCRRCKFEAGEIDQRRGARIYRVHWSSHHGTEQLHLAYSGKLSNVSLDINSFSPEWTELSLDSAWYPLEVDSRGFTYDLHIQSPPEYKLTGNGHVQQGAGEWRLISREKTNDIAIAAARDLQKMSTTAAGVQIDAYSSTIPESVVKEATEHAAAAVNLFSSWFGAAASKHLVLLLNPRVDGSSYSRPGYISIANAADPKRSTETELTIAHETAHFWWISAPGGTWENWLNESFAEYTTLMYVRQTKGDREFQRLLKEHAQNGAGSPVIWGMERHARGAPASFYRKGPALLGELEQMIGREKFDQVLRLTFQHRIASTADLLNLLQRETSPEVRSRFEEMLKTR